MGTCLEIGRVHIKYHLYPHLLISILFLAASPMIMGLSNLDAAQTAKVLDFYAVLLGVILLTPLFLPESDDGIRDLTASKYISETKVWGVRLAQSVGFLALLLLCFCALLRVRRCSFPFASYYFGTLAGALFLGGMGILASGLADQVVVGYMVPMMYYVGNFGGPRYFGKFYLFSLMKGEAADKLWLGIAGAVCIIIGMWYRRNSKSGKLRP